jgi:hypothetical protein
MNEYDRRGNGAVSFTPHMHLDAGGSEFDPVNISKTFNSVGGNMTQLNVTSYGESCSGVCHT